MTHALPTIPRSQPAHHPWPIFVEDHPRRWLVYPLLVIISLLLLYTVMTFHAGAHGGTDQNGYLVTSRLMLEENRLSFVPENPFQFVGHMMVLKPDGTIYAKYPIGFPVLAAISRAIGGVYWTYLINPISAALAVFLSFFLFRTVLGNFASLMGVIWMACNPLTLVFANDANSHTPALLCVVVGFWGLLTWWQGGRAWRGLLGGFALAYACTIRYTEFLLVLPVFYVVLARADFKLARLPRNCWGFVGWLIPIVSLSAVCWVAFDAPWRTGYSLCKEQTGFGLKYLLGDKPDADGNWATFLHQINHTGLFLLWPLALGGAIALFWHSFRLAVTIALWIVPATALYLCYYWAPGGEDGVWYLRFFFTIFPAMILCALWTLDRGIGMNRYARAASMGLLTAVGCAFNLDHVTPQLESTYQGHLSLRNLAQNVQRDVPRGSLIFVDESSANMLDEVGGYCLYNLTLFGPKAFDRFEQHMEKHDAAEPDPLQRERMDGYRRLLGVPGPDGLYKPKPHDEIDRLQLRIVMDSLARNRRVYFIFRGAPTWNMLAGASNLHLQTVTEWTDPLAPDRSAGTLLRTHSKKLIGDKKPLAPLPSILLRQRTWEIVEVVPSSPLK